MMKKWKNWSLCLLAVAMIALMASCNASTSPATGTTEEVTVSEAPSETKPNDPVTTTAPSDPITTTAPATTPEETKANIRPGKDEEHTWEGYLPFA